MTQKFTVIFDLDGTIVDTAPDLIGAHNHVMRKFGYKERKVDEIKYLAGRGAAAMMDESIGAERLRSEKITPEIMLKEFLDYYSNNIANESKPIKGAIDFFKWAANNQVSLAVCTNKTERLAVNLLKKIKLFDYFEYIAGHDTFNFHKPDGRHITNILEIIDGDLNKTIMVGDSEIDSMAAYNAKVPFVLIEDGYTSKKVNEIKHDHLIKNFLGFEKIVSKYL